MRASIAPALIDALVTACTAILPDVVVSDCYVDVNKPGDLTLLIGVPDMRSTAPARSASSTLEWATATRSGGRDQTGTITLLAIASRGDDQIKPARDAAYAVVAAVDELARTGYARTPDGGLVVLLGTALVPAETPAVDARVPGLLSAGVASEDLDQAMDASGCEAAVTFTVGYKARI